MRPVLILLALALAALVAWRFWARPVARGPAVERGEVTAAWQCVFTKEVEVAQLQNGQQVRRLLEAAHDGLKEAYPKHLLGCLPRLAHARQALGQAPSDARYAASLEGLERTLRLYAERLASFEPIEELDEEIVSHAHSWYSDDDARDRHAGYERFLSCAVPNLQALADDKALYDWLADQCFKHDPVPFMNRVRKDCGPLLEQETPSPTLAASRHKFHRGADSPQIQSWESCSDIAREQERMAAAREVVAASEEYLAARPQITR